MEKQFVGARLGDRWYCCVCLDIQFPWFVVDRLLSVGAFWEVQAVYTIDEWVQKQVCVGCSGRFDTEP